MLSLSHSHHTDSHYQLPSMVDRNVSWSWKYSQVHPFIFSIRRTFVKLLTEISDVPLATEPHLADKVFTHLHGNFFLWLATWAHATAGRGLYAWLVFVLVLVAHDTLNPKRRMEWPSRRKAKEGMAQSKEGEERNGPVERKRRRKSWMAWSLGWRRARWLRKVNCWRNILSNTRGKGDKHFHKFVVWPGRPASASRGVSRPVPHTINTVVN